MNTPTKITFSRIIAIVIMVVALFVLFIIGQVNPDFVIPTIGNTGINWVYFGLFIFFLIASFTDFLDGYLARKNNQVTDLGKFLDPVADKLLINSMVIFLVIPASYAPGQMSFSIWCAIILVARDIVVDALRFIAAQKGKVIAANIFGKIKTVLEMIAICFVLLNSWPFNYFDHQWVARILVYLATLASFISGVIYVIKNISVFKEDKNNAKALKEDFVNKGLTLGSIESFTGGSFASEVTKVAGASNYFKGSAITYATEEKEKVLGIPHDLVEKHGVVSEEIAREMAERGRKLLNVDVCVSFTGNAGPSAMEDKPVGEIYIGISNKEGTKVYPHQLKGDRKSIQSQAISLAMEELLKIDK